MKAKITLEQFNEVIHKTLKKGDIEGFHRALEEYPLLENYPLDEINHNLNNYDICIFKETLKKYLWESWETPNPDRFWVLHEHSFLEHVMGNHGDHYISLWAQSLYVTIENGSENEETLSWVRQHFENAKTTFPNLFKNLLEKELKVFEKLADLGAAKSIAILLEEPKMLPFFPNLVNASLNAEFLQKLLNSEIDIFNINNLTHSKVKNSNEWPEKRHFANLIYTSSESRLNLIELISRHPKLSHEDFHQWGINTLEHPRFQKNIHMAHDETQMEISRKTTEQLINSHIEFILYFLKNNIDKVDKVHIKINTTELVCAEHSLKKEDSVSLRTFANMIDSEKIKALISVYEKTKTHQSQIKSTPRF